MVLRGENILSKKSKIVCSVKVSGLEFVSLFIADKLQTAMCGTEDYKARLRKYPEQCC